MTDWQKNLAAEAAALAAKAAETQFRLGWAFRPEDARRLRAEIKRLDGRAAECRRLSEAVIVGA